MEKKNKTLAIVLGIFALVIVTTAASFAFFTYSRTGETTTTITSGDIEFSYIEGTDASLTNAFPVSDSVGAIDTKGEYKFDVKMTSSAPQHKMNYNVILLDNNKEVKDYFTNDQIKFALVKNGTYVADTKSTEGRLISSIEGFNPSETTGEGIVLANQEITSGTTDNYKLRIWISDTVNYSNGNEQTVSGKYNGYGYSLKVKVTSGTTETVKEDYKDNSGAPQPVIQGDLVPIKIGPDGTVTKADIYKEWYNYDNKEWANAVILENKSINYSNGQVIPESNIQSYMVWIPRYKYKLFNVESNTIQQQEIEIQFEDKATPVSIGTKNGEWLTHPAFTNFDVNGIWVGKYESGYKGAIDANGAEKNENDSSKLIVKPSVYSWRKITVGNAFNTSYNYKRDLDSHMMKNTEWGAVAYLTNSKYGRCTSGQCEEITINNNQNYVTGIAGNTVSASQSTDTTNKWNTIAGQKASTTGNMTGVYDMSGGADEYVMGYTTSASSAGGYSGLNQEWLDNPENQKYYDKYTGASISSRILGDATGETQKWFGDSASFFSASNPWFARGGSWVDGAFSGSLYFSRINGNANSYNSFRLVFAPRN